MSGRRLRITLSPAVLRWARERAGLDVDRTAGKVGVNPDRVLEWKSSEAITKPQADRLRGDAFHDWANRLDSTT